MTVETPPNPTSVPDSPPPGSRRLAPSLSGFFGGLVVLAVGAILLAAGVVHGRTTRVVEPAEPQPGAVSSQPGAPFDARAIYAKDAPGVAFVQAFGVVNDTPFGQSRGVIGINSQIANGGNGDGSVGIGFAVPIDTAKAELRSLERGGTVEHAFLGVQVGRLERPLRRGAVIVGVDPGGPAAKAGLRPDDVIVSLGGKRIADPDALAQIVGAHEPGQAVSLGYVRDGKRHTTRVTFAPRELTRPAAAS